MLPDTEGLGNILPYLWKHSGNNGPVLGGILLCFLAPAAIALGVWFEGWVPLDHVGRAFNDYRKDRNSAWEVALPIAWSLVLIVGSAIGGLYLASAALMWVIGIVVLVGLVLGSLFLIGSAIPKSSTSSR